MGEVGGIDYRVVERCREPMVRVSVDHDTPFAIAGEEELLLVGGSDENA